MLIYYTSTLHLFWFCEHFVCSGVQYLIQQPSKTEQGCSKAASCVLFKASVVDCRSIPLINTLNRPLINQHSIKPWLTLYRHLGQQSVQSQLFFHQFTWVSWHSANYGPTVDQLSIECRPCIDQDVNWVLIEMSKVSINTRPGMPLIHMILRAIKILKCSTGIKP